MGAAAMPLLRRSLSIVGDEVPVIADYIAAHCMYAENTRDGLFLNWYEKEQQQEQQEQEQKQGGRSGGGGEMHAAETVMTTDGVATTATTATAFASTAVSVQSHAKERLQRLLELDPAFGQLGALRQCVERSIPSDLPMPPSIR